MAVVLINPNLVVQRNDPFTTGIVYMPIGLAYVAASLRYTGYSIQVIDAFGEMPDHARRDGQFTILGLPDCEIMGRIHPDTAAIFIFALNLTNHIAAKNITSILKQEFPKIPVIILENTQAVTAYALRQVMSEFFEAGADYVLTGEAEQRAVQLLKILADPNKNNLLKNIDGLGTKDYFSTPGGFIQNLDELPFPAWDLFPLENYWNLRYAHGPQSTARYLPLLTSRGCPYPCRFCVVPATNQHKWRPRSAGNVVDEIEYYVTRYRVNEFHIEDLDPTISDKRIREIANEILGRGLDIVWKIVAGTKVETIRDEETIDIMAKSGCRYISISPETGSPRVLKLMRKPFNLEHAVKMVNRMNQVGIRSQACFVLGFPGENEDDLQQTWELVQDLTKKGVDEIALFIITPVPGSEIFDKFDGYSSLSEMNFSPTWRKDYLRLSRFRFRLYSHFLWWKLCYHPWKILRQPFNFLRRRYDTKMEMVPYRALRLKLLDRKAQ
jgi:anaerobic magnesium-protoporphyrin IX monomethyl ester cyclase